MNTKNHKEDIFLYMATICILCFLGWYFHISREHIKDAVSYNLEGTQVVRTDYLLASKMRYDFALKILLSNSTRTNLSFLIGSVLCLVGSMFVIRRSRIDNFEASGEVPSKSISLSLKTSSPGVLLSLFGTIIIIFSIIIKDKYNVVDNSHHKQEKKAPNNEGLTGHEDFWND